MYFVVIVALLVGLGAAIYLVYQAYSYIKCGCGKYGPFVSSYGQIKEDILDEARKVLSKSTKTLKVTDLGCGSGALLLPLAKEFPQHEFIGYEWDIVPLTMGKIKAHGLKNIKFIKGDYMKNSYKEMDLIMCYVLKVTGEPLGKKLSKEIKDSCVVISEMFPLYHLHEDKKIASSIYGVSENIYVYSKEKSSTTKKASVGKEISSKKNSVSPKKTAPKSGTRKTSVKKKTVNK